MKLKGRQLRGEGLGSRSLVKTLTTARDSPGTKPGSARPGAGPGRGAPPSCQGGCGPKGVVESGWSGNRLRGGKRRYEEEEGGEQGGLRVFP